MALDQVIELAQLGTLSYVPTPGYIGNDTFTWNGSDGSLWAAAAAPCQWSMGPVGGALILSGGPYNFVTDIGVTWPGTAVTVPDGTSVVFGATQHLQSLTIGQGASATFSGGAKTLFAGGLTVDGTGMSMGKLDLGDCDLILSYTGTAPSATIRQLLQTGLVNGTGIFSSTGTPAAPAAIGMVDNAMMHLTKWGDVTISDGQDFGQLILKHTVPGDTNLDGKVDSTDCVNIIANMGSTNAQWFQGDLNHDGLVTVDDLAEVTSHVGACAVFAAGPALPARPVAASPTAAKVAAKRVLKKPAPKHPAAGNRSGEQKRGLEQKRGRK